MSFNTHKKMRYGILALCLALSVDALAAGDKVRLSDDEIRALGEDPQGGEFYRLNLDQNSVNADQSAPNGGAGVLYTSIAGIEFRPISDHGRFFLSAHAALSCRANGTNSRAEAQLQFTHGATLQFLRIYGTDLSGDNLNVALVERCQPAVTAGNVTNTVLASVLTSGAPGQLTQSIAVPAATTVDNNLCIYSLRVQLADTANGCAFDAGLALDKARVQWIE